MTDTFVGPGFLLNATERLTGAWVNSWSIAAIPPLRRQKPESIDSQQLARDIFVCTWLALSIVASVAVSRSWPGPPWLLRGAAAVGSYRALDLFITLLRTGVFLSFRGDIELKNELPWRIRRILLAIFINYVELVLWYAVIYFCIAKADPAQFAGSHVTHFHHALSLSFSTMTTVGYGVSAPDSGWTTLIAFAQALTATILIVVVVAVLVSLLIIGGSSPTPASSPKSTWWKPLVGVVTLLTLTYLFFTCTFGVAAVAG
jgi:hypothetical protein